MPTYHACDITLRLGIAPLSETITRNIVLRKGEVAKQQCEEAEKKLRNSELLDEKQVFFPGDEHGFNLHWLGKAPFMQVQAGKGLNQRQNAADLITHVPSTCSVDPIDPQKLLAAHAGIDSLEDQGEKLPQALALHVKLSNRAFVSGIPSNQVHLKIEVLFNGQLSSCRLVPPHDIRSGAQLLHQIFSGHRIDYLAERPYVILPPGMTADGGIRAVDHAISAQERWKQISLALQGEAVMRGADKHGNVPPSAEFLYAISEMQMPEQVRNLQTPGGRRFGVIDVIITAGTGRKITSGTSYLKAPQRLGDQDFSVKIHRDRPEDGADVFGPGDEKQDESLIDTNTRDDSTLHYVPDPKGSSLPFASHDTPMLKFANPFSVMEIPPKIPSSCQDTLLDSFSPTRTKTNSRPTSPHKCKADYVGTPSSPVRGRAEFYDDANDKVREYSWNSDGKPHSVLQDTQSFMSQSLVLASSCRIRPSPYSFQLPCRYEEQTSPSDPMNPISSGVTATLSYPVQQTSDHNNAVSSQQQFVHDSAIHFAPLPMPPSSSQCITPMTTMCKLDQVLQGQYGFADAHSFRQATHGDASGAFASSMASFSRPLGSYGYAAYPCPPPFYRHFPGSLPPTGLYSVPTKPGSSSKSFRNPLPANVGLTDTSKTQSSIVINRLVITGKHGTTLIDQRWSVPQRVFVQQTDTRVFQSSKKLSFQDRVSVGSGTQCERPRSRSVSLEKQGTPASTCSSKSTHGFNALLSADKRKRDCASDKQIAPAHLPSDAIMKTPLLVEGHAPATKDTGTCVQGALMAIEVAVNQAMPRRGPATSSKFPSNQGPKTTTYIFEDLEEVSRETKRLRHPSSPTIPSLVNSIQPQPRTFTPIGNTVDVSEGDTSSPLSSVPSTPEQKLEMPSSPLKLSTSLSQLDGASHRRNTIPSPHIVHHSMETSSQKLGTSSPPKINANLARPFQHQLLSTAQSSPSPSTKKCKSIKQPRSPDRLKTMDNPPLNRDCVIAFAESEDKQREKGVLRQVKGERQGLFQEDYVVLATRFFIAGDIVEERHGKKEGVGIADL